MEEQVPSGRSSHAPSQSKSNQVKVTIEIFYAFRISFNVLDMLPQKEQTRTVFMIGVVLYLKKMENQRHSQLTSFVLAPVLKDLNEWPTHGWNCEKAINEWFNTPTSNSLKGRRYHMIHNKHSWKRIAHPEYRLHILLSSSRGNTSQSILGPMSIKAWSKTHLQSKVKAVLSMMWSIQSP